MSMVSCYKSCGIGQLSVLDILSLLLHGKLLCTAQFHAVISAQQVGLCSLQADFNETAYK